jgi:hypothetical protein
LVPDADTVGASSTGTTLIADAMERVGCVYVTAGVNTRYPQFVSTLQCVFRLLDLGWCWNNSYR